MSQEYSDSEVRRGGDTRSYSALLVDRRWIPVLVGVVIGCWLLLAPQGAHPDEHSHLVRSAALVRGVESADGANFDLSDRFLMPDPGCYAFQPAQPVTCTGPRSPSGETIALLTRAVDYPPGAHAIYGLATFLPGLEPVWWARLVGALVATTLVGAGLAVAARSSRLTAGALLVGITPMAWSIFSGVNPSSFVTAGAVALWIGLLHSTPDMHFSPRIGWLVAGGWAAMVVSRRDGLVWACLIAIIALSLTDIRILNLARRMGRSKIAVTFVSTAIAIAWAITSSSATTRLLVVAPVMLAAVEIVRAKSGELTHRWRGLASSQRIGIVTAVGLGGVALWITAMSFRPGGWNTNLVVTVLNQTDDNLVEAIGVLGWLDTPAPTPVVFAWLMIIGALSAWAAVHHRKGLIAAGALTVVAIVTSWSFELLQGNTSGTYWQGRYSMPLLMGIPLCLASGLPPLDELGLRLGRWCVIVGLGSVNVVAWAAARRWGVGTLGSHLPWKWDTSLQPVPPIVLLGVLAAASIALCALITRTSADDRRLTTTAMGPAGRAAS